MTLDFVISHDLKQLILLTAKKAKANETDFTCEWNQWFLGMNTIKSIHTEFLMIHVIHSSIENQKVKRQSCVCNFKLHKTEITSLICWFA